MENRKDGGKLLYLSPQERPGAEAHEAATTADGAATLTPEEALSALVRCMAASGFDPVTQLSGYLIAEDPTYLPDDCEVRAMVNRMGRDKLLETLIELYLAHHPITEEPV